MPSRHAPSTRGAPCARRGGGMGLCSSAVPAATRRVFKAPRSRPRRATPKLRPLPCASKGGWRAVALAALLPLTSTSPLPIETKFIASPATSLATKNTTAISVTQSGLPGLRQSCSPPVQPRARLLARRPLLLLWGSVLGRCRHLGPALLAGSPSPPTFAFHGP
jgi:hypothetical protein